MPAMQQRGGQVDPEWLRGLAQQMSARGQGQGGGPPGVIPGVGAPAANGGGSPWGRGPGLPMGGGWGGGGGGGFGGFGGGFGQQRPAVAPGGPAPVAGAPAQGGGGFGGFGASPGMLNMLAQRNAAMQNSPQGGGGGQGGPVGAFTPGWTQNLAAFGGLGRDAAGPMANGVRQGAAAQPAPGQAANAAWGNILSSRAGQVAGQNQQNAAQQNAAQQNAALSQQNQQNQYNQQYQQQQNAAMASNAARAAAQRQYEQDNEEARRRAQGG